MSSASTHRVSATFGVPEFGRLGRWSTTPTESLIASWSSAAIEILFSGSKLVVLVGEETDRKEKDNGGTCMLAIITGPTRREALINTEKWRVLDAEPGSELVIFDGVNNEKLNKTYVRIALIDWSSRFEVTGFLLDENGEIGAVDTKKETVPEILVIGDSITAAWATPDEPFPFGCLSTFVWAAERTLRESRSTEIEMRLISYPGFCLVNPTPEEKKKGQRNGMVEAFFWETPWSDSTETHPPIPPASPTVVLIELGTNDQSFDISTERFGKALVDLIVALKKWSKNSIKHIWLMPPFPDTDTTYRELNLAMDDFVTTLQNMFIGELNIKLCDLPAGLTVEDTNDGVHPRLHVHETLGLKFAEFIEKELF